MLTVEMVEYNLRTIWRAAKAQDHEAAHRLEDETFVVVLEAIRDGRVRDAAAVAAAALESRDIAFKRVCA